MKKKLAIIIPASVAAIVVIAVTVVVFVYAIPFLKISKNINKDGYQPDSPSATEVAGSVSDETVTDENGEIQTRPADETAVTATEPGSASTGDKTTTEKTSSGTTQGTSQNSNTQKPGTTQTTTPTTSASKPGTTNPSKPGTTNSSNPGKTDPTKPAVTSPAPNTTKPADPVTTPSTTNPQNTKSEYDIYRSGRFYAKGTAIDSDGMVAPLELAVTDKTVYMISQIDGVNIGILVDGKKSYMIYTDKKKYCELSSVLMNAADLNPDEMIATAKESYAELQPLDKAVRLAEGTVNGQNCKTYHFKNEEHELTTVSINGNKLVQVVKYDSNGRIETTINFTSVSADIPAEKMAPPKSYKKVGMITFLMELSKDMGVELE